jgi:hypothetical protein
MNLITLINEISKTEDQELKNILILEFTYRIYVPFKDKTFEELLIQNGYKVKEKENDSNSKRI